MKVGVDLVNLKSAVVLQPDQPGKWRSWHIRVSVHVPIGAFTGCDLHDGYGTCSTSYDVQRPRSVMLSFASGSSLKVELQPQVGGGVAAAITALGRSTSQSSDSSPTCDTLEETYLDEALAPWEVWFQQSIVADCMIVFV